MTYSEVLRYFGTQIKIAEALRIGQPTVSDWKGVVPDRYQYQLEVITRGDLRADRHLRRRAFSSSRKRNASNSVAAS